MGTIALIMPEPYRLHDLRHTYASILIANRESLKYIQRMLGHESVKTTVDTYGHLIDESNMPAARRLDEAVFFGKKPEGKDEFLLKRGQR